MRFYRYHAQSPCHRWARYQEAAKTWLLLFLSTCLATGCERPTYLPPTPTVPADAIKALEQVLKAWQNAELPGSLQALSSPIMVRDEDWQTGLKLQDFKIQGEPERYGHDVRILVQLSLLQKGSSSLKKTVRYTVATEPSISVMRDDTID